jgi:hypothetical protein
MIIYVPLQTNAKRVVEDILEKDLILRVSELMDKKYGWSDGLIVELSPS